MEALIEEHSTFRYHDILLQRLRSNYLLLLQEAAGRALQEAGAVSLCPSVPGVAT